jgi:glycosidase
VRWRAILATALLLTGSGVAVTCAQTRIPSWVADAVFYQIFPERFANGDPSNDPRGVQPWGGVPSGRDFFGGDLQGIIDHLDYIESLGANALYLNPIFLSPSNHKYNTTDYMRIDPAFGNEQIFKQLVDACHARGMRIILDGVFNHTSTDFFAFADLRKRGERSVYREWYDVHSYPVGPEDHPNYECWWGYGSLPKLMTGYPAVQEYLFAVTRKWMSFGIDGWRLDVPNEVAPSFWTGWRKVVKSINPDAYCVAELWENAAPWLQGDQFDATMNYRFRAAVLGCFGAHRLSFSGLDSTLAAQRLDYHPDVNLALQNLLGSHDTERQLTFCGGDPIAVRLAMVLQMTYPGAPMIYYGDEVGMTGGKDPECRKTMVWDEEKQDHDLLNFTRELVHLRRQNPVWRRGTFQTLRVDDRNRIYVYARVQTGVRGVVVIHDGLEPVTIRLPRGEMMNPTLREIWPEPKEVTPDQDGTIVVTIPPRGARIFLETAGR